MTKEVTNERIKELARQSQLVFWPTDPEVVELSKDIDIEKFAELIVQEAADVAYNTYWNNPDKVRGAHLKQAIKRHFGVTHD